MRTTIRAMFKETKQKCVRDQRGTRKTEKLKTYKTLSKQYIQSAYFSFNEQLNYGHYVGRLQTVTSSGLLHNSYFQAKGQ